MLNRRSHVFTVGVVDKMTTNSDERRQFLVKRAQGDGASPCSIPPSDSEKNAAKAGRSSAPALSHGCPQRSSEHCPLSVELGRLSCLDHWRLRDVVSRLSLSLRECCFPPLCRGPATCFDVFLLSMPQRTVAACCSTPAATTRGPRLLSSWCSLFSRQAICTLFGVLRRRRCRSGRRSPQPLPCVQSSTLLLWIAKSTCRPVALDGSKPHCHGSSPYLTLAMNVAMGFSSTVLFQSPIAT